MTKKKPKRITAWSASAIDTFETCPAKLQFQKTLPQAERPPDHPLELGLRIHKEGEAYLQGKTKKVPAFYKYFAKDLGALKRLKAKPEVQLAFTKTWGPTTWFADDVRCRMALDAVVERKRDVRVVDFKTGRMYAKDEEQMELYAVGLFHRYPEITKVVAELWYLKLDQQVTLTIPREEKTRLQWRWEERAQKLLDATEFPPKPGPAGKWPCAWCDYSKKKGGPCKAG